MTDRITFEGFDGAKLSGLLDRAGTNARGGVLMAHCFTCSKDLSLNTRLAKRLSAGGYHVLRFDFTGLGESDGDFEGSTFVANVGDLTRAARWMLDAGYGPTALVGHSLGGAASLIAAGKIRSLKSVVTIGAPAMASHVLHLIDEAAQAKAHVEGCTFVKIAGRTFPLSDRFLHELESYDHAAAIRNLTVPLMVMHAPEDEIVPVSEGERIFSEANQPKAFVPLVGADHLLNDKQHVDSTADQIIDWLDRISR